MNYLAEIREFYNWMEWNQIDSSGICLWHALMHIANKTGWQQEFTAPIATLEFKTGLNRSAIYRARNALRQLGRIEFKERGGKQCSVYTIIPLVFQKEAQFETQTEHITEHKPNTNRTQTEHITEPLNKPNKTKQNTPPKPPQGGWGDVSPELLAVLTDFEEMRKKMRKPLTDRAKQLNLAKLRKLAPDEKTQIAIVERSIERSWQGFYALDKQEDAPAPQEKLLTLEDIYGQRGAERFRRGYARPEGGGAGL